MYRVNSAANTSSTLEDGSSFGFRPTAANPDEAKQKIAKYRNGHPADEPTEWETEYPDRTGQPQGRRRGREIDPINLPNINFTTNFMQSRSTQMKLRLAVMEVLRQYKEDASGTFRQKRTLVENFETEKRLKDCAKIYRKHLENQGGMKSAISYPAFRTFSPSSAEINSQYLPSCGRSKRRFGGSRVDRNETTT